MVPRKETPDTRPPMSPKRSEGAEQGSAMLKAGTATGAEPKRAKRAKMLH